MANDDSREIRREYVGSDVRFEFPIRPLGAIRLMGLFLIGFGVLFLWQPAHELWNTFQHSLHETSGGPGKLFSLFGIPFVLAGLVPIAIGLLIMFGRCRVEWKDGRLCATEILGLLRWTRRLPRKPIAKLEVAAATATNQRGTAAPQPFNQFSGLAVVFEDGTKILLVLGYPKDWVLDVADELKGYVGGTTTSFIPPAVEVIDSTGQNPNDADVLQPPAGSRVQVTEPMNGLRIFVPSAGLWRGSKGFVFFPLMWCAFMAVFTTLALLSGTKRDGSALAFIPFLLLFWAIGLGMLVFAVNLGRRTAELVVEGNVLRVETKGLFGIQANRWARDEIAAIRADRSNLEVNHRPVIELQIHPRTGKKLGLLAGRDEAELRWLATRLRQTLEVPAR